MSNNSVPTSPDYLSEKVGKIDSVWANPFEVPRRYTVPDFTREIVSKAVNASGDDFYVEGEVTHELEQMTSETEEKLFGPRLRAAVYARLKEFHVEPVSVTVTIQRAPGFKMLQATEARGQAAEKTRFVYVTFTGYLTSRAAVPGEVTA